MTSSDPRELFSEQLKEATRASNEEQSIRQQTLQFNLALAAENAIATLYPRQGTLNDIHTDRLLQKFKMSQQQQHNTNVDDDDDVDDKAQQSANVLTSPPRASSASRAVALSGSGASGSPAAKKAFEVVSVKVDGKAAKKKKKTDESDDSDSSDAAAPYVDGTKDKPVVKKQKKKSKHRTADDGSGDDGEESFDEKLSKKSKSKKRADGDDEDDDADSLGSKDSVELEIDSLNEEDDAEDDGDASDIIDDESEESDDEAVDNEVAQRLRAARAEVERKFKKQSEQSSDSDDDDDFTDNKPTEEGDDDDDGEESDSDADDADDDEAKRPRKLAKNSVSHAASSKTGGSSKKSSSRMALDDATQTAKKSKKSSSSASKPAASTSSAVKETMEAQRKRKADRRENADWVTKDALNTVISVACSQLFRRHLAKEKKTTNVSFFDLIMKDDSDDKDLQTMRGNLLAVSTIIQESLTIAENGSPKEMREIIDFVRNAKEIRTSRVTNTSHTECGITGVTSTAIAIELLEADHYTADDKTVTKKLFALKSLRKLIDSVAFLVNFHERCEQIVKDRLVHIKGYAPKLLVRDYIKLLEEDPAQKNAFVLLRTALKVHLDVVDMSLTIFKESH